MQRSNRQRGMHIRKKQKTQHFLSQPPPLQRQNSDRIHPFMRQGAADRTNNRVGHSWQNNIINFHHQQPACLAGDKKPIRGDVPTYIIVAHGMFLGDMISVPEKDFNYIAFGTMIPEDTLLEGSSTETGEANLQASANQHYKGIIDGTYKVFQRYAWKDSQNPGKALFPNIVFQEGGNDNSNNEFISTIVKVTKEQPPLFYKLTESVSMKKLTPFHEDARAYRGHSLDWLQSDELFVFGRSAAPHDLLLNQETNSTTLGNILEVLRKDAYTSRKDGAFNIVFATCLGGLPVDIQPYWLGSNKEMRILPFKKTFATDLRTSTADLLMGTDDGNIETKPLKQLDDSVVYIYNPETGDTDVAPKKSSSGGKKSRKRRRKRKRKTRRKTKQKRKTRRGKRKKRKIPRKNKTRKLK